MRVKQIRILKDTITESSSFKVKTTTLRNAIEQFYELGLENPEERVDDLSERIVELYTEFRAYFSTGYTPRVRGRMRQPNVYKLKLDDYLQQLVQISKECNLSQLQACDGILREQYKNDVQVL